MKIQRERGSGQPLGMLVRAQKRAGQREDSELGNPKSSVTFTKIRPRSDQWRVGRMNDCMLMGAVQQQEEIVDETVNE